MLCVVPWKAAPGYPRTQYEWAKASVRVGQGLPGWNKKRFRELGLDAWSDTDKDKDSREDNAGFQERDILPDGSGKGAEEDNARAAAEAQACKHAKTPPTAKKASLLRN